MISLKIDPNHKVHLPHEFGRFVLTMNANEFYAIRVYQSHRVLLTPSKAEPGWTHAWKRPDIGKYGPEGFGGPIQSGLFARPEMPVGALVAGYVPAPRHAESLDTMNLDDWTTIFQKTIPPFRRELNVGRGPSLFIPPADGLIYLIMNDALSYPGDAGPVNGYGDNEGIVWVDVQFQKV